jgi:uncharacterized protein
MQQSNRKLPIYSTFIEDQTGVMKTFGEIAFTPAVQALQERDGSRAAYARIAERGAPEGLGPDEAEFLGRADSFYLATVGETGWPYVQHRGGPRGFLKVVSPTRITFPDFRGNRQYVSVGNVANDDRASMIVMDYVNRRRLKLLGHLRFHDAGTERVATFDVEAFDWNCPQHITPRYTRAEWEARDVRRQRGL